MGNFDTILDSQDSKARPRCSHCCKMSNTHFAANFLGAVVKRRIARFSVDINSPEGGSHDRGRLEDGQVHGDLIGYGLSDWLGYE